LLKEVTIDQLVALAMEIIPYDMQHNAETDACDLLMEIERLDKVEEHTDENNFQRVCLYLTR
jgi:26S proteasome regulatory subunit N1